MYTTPENLAFIGLAGLGAGVLGAMLGTGGGVLLVPLLLLGFGVPMHYAIATSIVSVIATSSAVATTNVELGTANMRLGVTLELATVLGAITGGLVAGWLSAGVLEMLFAVVLLPTAWVMWRRGGEQSVPEGNKRSTNPPAAQEELRASENSHFGLLGARYYDPATHTEVRYRVERLWAGLMTSYVAGNMSGLLGIGGGVFKVPALCLFCGVPIKAAAATSNFMIGVTAAASAFLYYGRGEVRPALTAAVVLGVLIGSVVGTSVNRFVGGVFVQRLFAVLLVTVAVQMAIRAWGPGG